MNPISYDRFLDHTRVTGDIFANCSRPINRRTSFPPIGAPISPSTAAAIPAILLLFLPANTAFSKMPILPQQSNTAPGNTFSSAKFPAASLELRPISINSSHLAAIPAFPATRSTIICSLKPKQGAAGPHRSVAPLTLPMSKSS